MQHRNISTTEWTRMAIDSLFERGTLPDWKEFADALHRDDGTLAGETLFMCERHEDKGSCALAKTLVEHFRPEILPPASSGQSVQEERPLSEVLKGLIGAVDSSKETPGRQPSGDFVERELGPLIKEKFRKQGLVFPEDKS